MTLVEALQTSLLILILGSVVMKNIDLNDWRRDNGITGSPPPPTFEIVWYVLAFACWLGGLIGSVATGGILFWRQLDSWGLLRMVGDFA
jgi:hypothetical protein